MLRRAYARRQPRLRPLAQGLRPHGIILAGPLARAVALAAAGTAPVVFVGWPEVPFVPRDLVRLLA
ncbi:MAG: hypothetical protein WD981_00340 [Gaiellaceae bacterium]